MFAVVAVALALQAQASGKSTEYAGLMPVTGPELTRLLSGVSITRVRTQKIADGRSERFDRDGRWLLVGGGMQRQGTYRIQGADVCVQTLHRELCRRIYRDRLGRMYMTNGSGAVERPGEIKVQ